MPRIKPRKAVSEEQPLTTKVRNFHLIDSFYGGFVLANEKNWKQTFVLLSRMAGMLSGKVFFRGEVAHKN